VVYEANLTCVASIDSFLEYGLNTIYIIGNFFCSIAIANLIVDFSTKSRDNNVVDSPSSRAPQLPKLCSPLPLWSRDLITSRMLP